MNIDILLVDDSVQSPTPSRTSRPWARLCDSGTVRLAREVMKENKNMNLHAASDGIEAMAFLHQEEPFTDAVHPHLILLDLNMPRMDGREVLAEIKSDPNLHRIPVIVLTTSTAEKDIRDSYDLHASAYITKPDDLDQFVEVFKSVEAFWFNVAKLPRNWAI